MGSGRGATGLSPAVFLDRDGVVNAAIVREGRPHPPATLAELRFEPGAGACVERLREHGFRVVVVTNQPDVARGTTTRAAVETLNAAIGAELPLDGLYACYHDDADACPCRKPKPGMLLRAAEELGLDLAGSYMVGDRWSDVEAGRRAGCRTVWIERGYLERAAEHPDARVTTLAQACEWIIDDHRDG
ncbi:MAG TPA: HAD family hydrolase [Candidatus Elarobacter sp.]|nr:HAD family hydrolase [Candidatus Elarobacter sp.]